MTGFWARTRTEGLAREGLAREDTSYRAALDYSSDRYGVQLRHMVIGRHFNPEVGFVRRPDIQKTVALFRFSPRPASPRVRKYSWSGTIDHIANGTGQLESRRLEGEFGVEYERGDRLQVSYQDLYELLLRPFQIAPGVRLPTGGYGFRNLSGSYAFRPQGAFSGTVRVERGSL